MRLVAVHRVGDRGYSISKRWYFGYTRKLDEVEDKLSRIVCINGASPLRIAQSSLISLDQCSRPSNEIPYIVTLMKCNSK